MRETGIFFGEEPVPDGAGFKRTDDLCRQLADDHYSIAGRDVRLPVHIRCAAMVMNAFVVPAGAIKAIIQGSGCRPMELWPGKGVMLLTVVDYRESDLDSYHEGAIMFAVLTPGQSSSLLTALRSLVRGSISHFVYRMPVDQPFTTHAGRFIWGFPKWVTTVQVEAGEGQSRGRLVDDGELVYEIAAGTGGHGSIKHQQLAAVAIRNGMAWKTYGTGDGSEVTFRMGGAEPRIGDRHPLAKQLRLLGLPKKPLCCASAKVQVRFDRAEVVAIGAPFVT